MHGLITDKCCFRYNGTLYQNIKFVGTKYGDLPGDDVILINSELKNEIQIPSLGYKIPVGSKVYLANNIPIGVETIRKSYTIKRKAEDADYIIMNPKPKYSKGEYAVENQFYYDEGILISTHWMNADNSQALIKQFGLEDKQSVRISTMYFNYIRDAKGCILKYFNGTFPKPLAPYTDLDLETGDDLNADVVLLTYRLGNKRYTDISNDINNYVLNLKALNNYNWRKYKGTFGILFRCMDKNYESCHRDIRRRINSQCKTVYDVVNTCQAYKGFENDEDLNLAQEVISKLLNMEQFPMFVYPSTILSKIDNINMSLSDFESIFNTITKITKDVEPKN